MPRSARGRKKAECFSRGRRSPCSKAFSGAESAGFSCLALAARRSLNQVDAEHAWPRLGARYAPVCHYEYFAANGFRFIRLKDERFAQRFVSGQQIQGELVINRRVDNILQFYLIWAILHGLADISSFCALSIYRLVTCS